MVNKEQNVPPQSGLLQKKLSRIDAAQVCDTSASLSIPLLRDHADDAMKTET
jgi:hypothetical protein